jgi:hypothetical protein
MGKIIIEVELSTEQTKLLEAYIGDHCLDLDKWLKRMVYGGLYAAVGRYKQPRGRIADAFEGSEAKGITSQKRRKNT